MRGGAMSEGSFNYGHALILAQKRRPLRRWTRILLSFAAFALVFYVIIVESGLMRNS